MMEKRNSKKRSLLEQDLKQNGQSIFAFSEDLGQFDFGPDHPFKPERAAKTYDLCIRYGVMNHPWMKVMKPESPAPVLLELFHEPAYVELLKEASDGEVRIEMLERGLGTADNPILPGIFEWSLRAAGGTYACMRELITGNTLVAFNPLGGFHHAMAGQAEGFCYINDIAITMKDALRMSPGLKVAYLDFDAHHGNGVQEAFYEDPEVLVISLHQTGRTLYPWTGYETEKGRNEGLGFNINVPLEPGTDDEVYLYVYEEVVIPVVRAFGPDLIVAELGADALISDPLTQMKLTNNAYQRVVKSLLGLCPKILALGGGGYDVYRTARCWTLAWAILNYLEPEDEFAGLVGGMMFGPEMEVGSLYDHPILTKGEIKERAMMEAQRVVAYIQGAIFPIHGL
ncbi:MAG: acetoin utilization protein AcuC [Deltaproteobacteria bacterium]|nr:acetoin utilization protein AcuC [Deltaproteobacteria bacterium]